MQLLLCVCFFRCRDYQGKKKGLYGECIVHASTTLLGKLNQVLASIASKRHLPREMKNDQQRSFCVGKCKKKRCIIIPQSEIPSLPKGHIRPITTLPYPSSSSIQPPSSFFAIHFQSRQKLSPSLYLDSKKEKSKNSNESMACVSMCVGLRGEFAYHQEHEYIGRQGFVVKNSRKIPQGSKLHSYEVMNDLINGEQSKATV